MRINVTARGRKGDISKSAGSLTLLTDCDGEAVQLKYLYQELRDGNLGFWTPLMFACRKNKLTIAQEKVLSQIVHKVEKEFLAECGETT